MIRLLAIARFFLVGEVMRVFGEREIPGFYFPGDAVVDGVQQPHFRL